MPPVIPPPADTPVAEPRIVRYVLGQLIGPELEQLEDRLIADAAFFEHVQAVEADVCDDYAAGRLAAADRLAFEERLRGNDRLQRRVAFARALHARAVPAVAGRPWHWWAVAAALTLLTASAVWFARTGSERPPAVVVVQPPDVMPVPTATPTPPPGDRPAPAPARPAVLATLTLFGPVVRDPAQIPAIAVPPGDGVIRIEVAVQDGDVFPSYRAQLAGQGGAAIWTGAPLSAVTVAGARMIVGEVPAPRLLAGQYQLDVYGVRSGVSTRLASYSFRVTR